MLTENETSRIAAAVNALRPDWPAASLRTLIATKLGDRTRRDVTVALAWVACDSESKTPARVLEAGPWWKAVLPDGAVYRHPPKRHEACRLHPGEWADACRCCAADRLAGTMTTAATSRQPGKATGRVDEIRHLHAVATRDLCPCGVEPRHCAEHRDVTA